MNKRKTILVILGLMLMLTVAGELLLSILFDGYAGKAHLLVPVFFFALYALPVAITAQPVDSRHFLQQYMVFKGLKLFVSLGALVAFGFAFKEQVVGVFVNFLIYSLVMIVVENIYVLNLKKKIAKGT